MVHGRWVSYTRDGSVIPSFDYENEIISAIERNDVTIIAGETGSGKSTVIPHLLLRNHPQPHNARILVTQPRRLAAVSLSRYVNKNVASDPEVISKLAQVRKNVRTDLGAIVGYKVRFDHVANLNTNIVYETDGLLVRELTVNVTAIEDSNYGFLSKLRYDYVIIDEAHERSTRIDMLLCLFKYHMLTNARKPFKLIIMSATIDTQIFYDYYANCSYSGISSFPTTVGVCKIPGRTYPVTRLYLPTPSKDLTKSAVSCLIRILVEGEPGDILIFTSGYEQIDAIHAGVSQKLAEFEDFYWLATDIESLMTKLTSSNEHALLFKSNDEVSMKRTMLMDHYAVNPESLSSTVIENMTSALNDGLTAAQKKVTFHRMGSDESTRIFPLQFPKCRVLKLYGSQTPDEQNLVYALPETPNERKVIISTNIAETSLTLPNVRYVIDTGLFKCKSTMSLREATISKDMADQRAGRAGRVSNGVAIRLYTSKTYDQMEPFSVPEILRTDLKDFIISILAIDELSEIRVFSQLHKAQTADQLLSRLLMPLALPPEVLTSSIHYMRENAILEAPHDTLTRKGKLIALLPLPVVWGNLLVEAILSSVKFLNEIIIIVALCSNEIMWLENSTNERVLEVRKRLFNPSSDHLGLLNVYSIWSSAVDPRKLVQYLALDERNFTNCKNIISQLRDIILNNPLFNQHLPNKMIPSASKLVELKQMTQTDLDTSIRKIIYSAMRDNIAIKIENQPNSETHTYANPKIGTQLKIHPSSTFFMYKTKRPAAVVFSRLIETNGLYMHDVTAIDPEWILADK